MLSRGDQWLLMRSVQPDATTLVPNPPPVAVDRSLNQHRSLRVAWPWWGRA